MNKKIIETIFFLFPLSLILTYFAIRFFRVRKRYFNHLIIFAIIYGTLILLYLIFTA